MEYRDLYDENKLITGEVIKKGDVVPRGRYYLTVVVWIENSKGDLLIQKRLPEKYHMWATTGGHPKSGESSLEGMVTELKEELGINVDSKELKLFKTIKTEDDFVDLYYLKKNIDIKNIIVQKEEVEDVKWVTNEEIDELIKQGNFLSPHIDFYKYLLEFKKNNMI